MFIHTLQCYRRRMRCVCVCVCVGFVRGREVEAVSSLPLSLCLKPHGSFRCAARGCPDLSESVLGHKSTRSSAPWVGNQCQASSPALIYSCCVVSKTALKFMFVIHPVTSRGGRICLPGWRGCTATGCVCVCVLLKLRLAGVSVFLCAGIQRTSA